MAVHDAWPTPDCRRLTQILGAGQMSDSGRAELLDLGHEALNLWCDLVGPETQA